MADKTFVQNRGDDVRLFADRIKKLRKAAVGQQVPDTVRWNEIANVSQDKKGDRKLEIDLDKLGVWLKENAQQGKKWTRVSALWVSEYLTRAINKLMVDNGLLRGGEFAFEKGAKLSENIKNKEGKKIGETFVSRIVKNRPWVFSYLMYYLIATTFVAGAVKEPVPEQDKEEVKKENVEKETDSVPEKEQDKFENFVLNPNASEEEWQKQIDAVQPYVLSHIFSTEGYIKKAYFDVGASSGTLTFGAGFTIADRQHRSFASKILGRKLGNGSEISIQETKILVDAWMREKVYPPMKKAFKKPLPARLFVGLAVAAYNAGESTYTLAGNSGVPVVEAVNAGKSIQEIVDVYVRAYGKQRGTQWGGMPNKYGVCALYMLGHISEKAILESIGEAPYTIEPFVAAVQKQDSSFNKQNMVQGRLLVYDGNAKESKPIGVKYYDNLDGMLTKTKFRKTKGTVQLPVQEYFSTQEVKTMLAGNLFQGKTADFMREFNKNVVIEQSESEKLNEEGEFLFVEGKYADAEKKFKAAIKADKNNYIVYSNLSILYYHMGRFDDGLKIVQSLINSDKMKSVPDEIKSYTYYNAALCREGLGDKAKTKKQKQEHYKLSEQNLKLSEKYSGTEHGMLKQRLKEKMNNLSAKKQVVAFNDGIKKMESKKILQINNRDFSNEGIC